jgi:hypothetical protein
MSSAVQPLGWFAIVRLGLAQLSLGAVVVLTTSTLNRVMVIELALPALIPGLLVALHYAVQVLRPAAEPDARVARQLAVALADVALRPAVPDVQERRAPGAASAFRLVRVLPSAAPVRRPAANFVRATLRWRTASPSAQSWQAARDEALS